MTSVHVHIWYYAWDTRGYFIKQLTNIFDFSELANKQTNEYYELKNIYTHSRDEYFLLIIRCKLQNIYRFINVKAGWPILPGIRTNSLGSKFGTGTNCPGNFGRPEHLAAGPSSLIHRVVWPKAPNKFSEILFIYLDMRDFNYIYTYMYVCVYICVCMCVYMYVYVYVHAGICGSVWIMLV